MRNNKHIVNTMISIIIITVVLSFSGCFNNDQEKNIPPVANAGGNQIFKILLDPDAEGVGSSPNVFNGSESYDPDGSIINYTWDFGDRQKGYGIIVTHTYNEIKNYTVRLTVKDNDGEIGSDSVIVFWKFCRLVSLNITNYDNPKEIIYNFDYKENREISLDFINVSQVFYGISSLENGQDHTINIMYIGSNVNESFTFYIKDVGDLPKTIYIIAYENKIEFSE